MMQTGSPSSLQARHATIDDRIRTELSRPMPDAVAVASMKKQKLLIKDTLTAR